MVFDGYYRKTYQLSKVNALSRLLPFKKLLISKMHTKDLLSLRAILTDFTYKILSRDTIMQKYKINIYNSYTICYSLIIPVYIQYE